MDKTQGNYRINIGNKSESPEDFGHIATVRVNVDSSVRIPEIITEESRSMVSSTVIVTSRFFRTNAFNVPDIEFGG